MSVLRSFFHTARTQRRVKAARLAAEVTDQDPDADPVADREKEPDPEPKPLQEAETPPTDETAFRSPDTDPHRSKTVPVDAHSRLKELAARDRPTLAHIIILTQLRRGADPQLLSKEAKTAKAALLARLYDLDRDVAGRYGVIEFKPSDVAFLGLFDAMGNQQLSEFLGLNGKVPDGNLPSLPASQPMR